MDTPYTCFDQKDEYEEVPMKGKTGATTSIYHTRLPHQRKLQKMARNLDLSRGAKVRLTWLTHYKKHGNATVTSRRFGISRSTLHKWVKRYAERGPRGLEDLSRAPHNRRTPTVAWQTVELICSIRAEQPAWSKHKIAVILLRDHDIKLSASTVGRVMKKKGLYDERVSRKRSKAAKRARDRLRAEWWMKNAFPGCLIQVDTKHLRFGEHKYYQFTAIDCFSRVAFCRVSSSISSSSASRFLDEVADFMPFPLVALQTDNGSEFLRHFDAATQERLVTHYFSHPNCPKENAHVERKIQTTKYELWAFAEAQSVPALNELVDEWNYTYNHVRPHQSLGYLTPMEFMSRWKEAGEDREQVSTM
jgi:transposase InsO family protein